MKIRFYYTWGEIEAQDSPTWPKTANKGPYDLINSCLGGTVDTDTTYTKELLQHYIWPAMYNKTIFYLDVEVPWYGQESFSKPTINDTRVQKLIKEFYAELWSDLKYTQPYYEKVIALYASKENDLLNQIQSETFNRYNETPQTSTGGLDTDDYANNTSKTVTSTDGGSTISRLEEIRQNYINFYRVWSKEITDKMIIWED